MQGCFLSEREQDVVCFQIVISFDRSAVTRQRGDAKCTRISTRPRVATLQGRPRSQPRRARITVPLFSRRVYHPTYEHSWEVKLWCPLLLIHYQITSRCLFRLLSLNQGTQIQKHDFLLRLYSREHSESKFSGQEGRKWVSLHSR